MTTAKRLTVDPPSYFGGTDTRADREFDRLMVVLRQHLGNGGPITHDFLNRLSDAVGDRIGEAVDYVEALPNGVDPNPDDWDDNEYEARLGRKRRPYIQELAS